MHSVKICLCLIHLLGMASYAQELGNITIYNTNNSELNYNTINCLEFDDLNRLWIGTNSGLSIFNEVDNSWINIGYDILESNITTLHHNTINEMSSMFIGTMNGIKQVSWDSDELNSNIQEWNWDNNIGNACEPNNGFINTILHNNSNQMWAGSTDGLCVENLGDEGSWLIQNTENGFYSSNITSIVKSTNSDMIAIGTINGGLITYETDFNIYYSSDSGILDNTVLDVAFDQNNNTIICTPQAGIGVLTDSGSWIWFNTINSDLPTNSLQNIIIDNNNSLWITTLENGLINYMDNNFYHYNIINSELPDNNINCMKFGPDNNLWLGTETQGLVKIDAAETSIQQAKKPSINIWPNIFDDKINIQIDQAATIYILNLEGQIIENYIFKAGYNNINTDKYKSGLYILIIESNNDISIKKLVKPY